MTQRLTISTLAVLVLFQTASAQDKCVPQARVSSRLAQTVMNLGTIMPLGDSITLTEAQTLSNRVEFDLQTGTYSLMAGNTLAIRNASATVENW